MTRAPRAPRTRPPCMTWTPAAAPELAELEVAEPEEEVELEVSLESPLEDVEVILAEV